MIKAFSNYLSSERKMRRLREFSKLGEIISDVNDFFCI